MSDRDPTNPSSSSPTARPTEAVVSGKSTDQEHVVEILPNPLTKASKLIVHLCRGEYVRADLYDIGGERMQRLFEGFMEAGEFCIPIKRRLLHKDTCICIVEIAGRKYHQVLTSGA
ncbi:MAG: hypothetical protein AB7H80_05270 [Candidatus Kapaibacterium sp.]